MLVQCLLSRQGYSLCLCLFVHTGWQRPRGKEYFVPSFYNSKKQILDFLLLFNTTYHYAVKPNTGILPSISSRVAKIVWF